MFYQMMQKFYEAKKRFDANDKWEISKLMEELADLSMTVAETTNDDYFTLDEQLAHYRNAFMSRLSFESENTAISEEEREIIIGLINEMTCSDQYVRKINS